MRPLDTSNFMPITEPYAPGPATMLQWVEIAHLVVDDTYQRPIYGAGLSNVRKIARDFSWSKFAPVIVSPVAGGRYAIIDGQHRATAAALRGEAMVPAMIVIADRAGQAAAFKAINGVTTRIHKLSLQAAAVAAGDPAALELKAIADAAGVEILRYPRAADRMEPGQTMAAGAIVEALRTFGREAVITALTCITETKCNVPGALSMSNIKAITSVLGANHVWREAGGRLLEAFDEIDLEHENEEARVTRRAKGVAGWEVLADRLRARLTAFFATGGGEADGPSHRAARLAAALG